MAVRLPSLNVLTAFEAAARHVSFKEAATELFLTPSAVSHQVKVLEKELNLVLFKRLNRALELTPEGQRYYLSIRGPLNQLKQATEELLAGEHGGAFRINSIPFITNTLIIPHLQDFKNSHKNLHIQIESRIKRIDFGAGNTDVAIRYKKGNEEDLHYEEITPISITPVCSKQYLNNYIENNGNKKNAPHNIIRLTNDPVSWPRWIDQWHKDLKVQDELLLDSYQGVLDSAQGGLGLAMGFLPALLPYLKSGELVLPFANEECESGHLYLVYPKQNANKPVIQSFQAWFKALIQALTQK
ncbi:MAG: LysR substrate-binding domain-containing protein [Bermanella sp.]